MSTGAPGNGSVPGITLDWASADVRRVLSRSEEHTSELQSQSNLVCRLLLEKKKKHNHTGPRPTRLNTTHSRKCYVRFSIIHAASLSTSNSPRTHATPSTDYSACVTHTLIHR